MSTTTKPSYKLCMNIKHSNAERESFLPPLVPWNVCVLRFFPGRRSPKCLRGGGGTSREAQRQLRTRAEKVSMMMAGAPIFWGKSVGPGKELMVDIDYDEVVHLTQVSCEPHYWQAPPPDLTTDQKCLPFAQTSRSGLSSSRLARVRRTASASSSRWRTMRTNPSCSAP